MKAKSVYTFIEPSENPVFFDEVSSTVKECITRNKIPINTETITPDAKSLNEAFSRQENISNPLYFFVFDTKSLKLCKTFKRKHPLTPTLIVSFLDEDIPEHVKNQNMFSQHSDLNIIFHKPESKYNISTKNPVHIYEANKANLINSPLLVRTLSKLLITSHLDEFEPDASVIRNWDHIELSYVTHFYCDQDNINTVTSLLDTYAAYDRTIRSRCLFIVVDDGSPTHYEIPDYPLNLIWIRIGENIPWNQAGARNAGVAQAKSEKILLTDIDHIFPEAAFHELLRRRKPRRKLYKVWRKNQDGGWIKAHPNIFFTSRSNFYRCFGYDEEYSGFYGAEDFRFVKFQKGQSTLQLYLPKSVWCTDRKDIDRDKSYHSLTRDLSFNSALDARNKILQKYLGRQYGHSRSSSARSWEIIKCSVYKEDIQISVNRLWKPLSILKSALNII